MKASFSAYLLAQLSDSDHGVVRIGRYAIITYDSGEVAARQDNTGLMTSMEPASRAGWQRILDQIDRMEAEDAVAHRLAEA